MEAGGQGAVILRRIDRLRPAIAATTKTLAAATAHFQGLFGFSSALMTSPAESESVSAP